MSVQSTLPADPITIGSDTFPGRPFLGDIAKVKLWAQALTPLQIADIYETERRGINKP